ncbi:glycosyltransferase family 2 protein [Leptothoe spongobia]|uniref:Glycosyltransferase n=1 Tax=Leptothoe spongobia TAU-MAC 1115 TaxID=1967444 RepID=A0A947DF79_9CYAN|nr:glycosyltransferase family 2 protein [Leptothoe spongobia]MBT9315559.1 glycosyltransferase [Leptothoe spongobia TAU-MAC 1115]
MPIISVIIPAYNSEKTIQESIDSVLTQTFSDFELIIVNDGSTDKTLELVEGIKDPRLRILSFENAGAAATRNRGIAKAKGDFIAFLDADDIWTTGKLADQLAAFKHEPSAGLVYSWSDYINFSGDFLCVGKRVITSESIEDTYAKLLVSNFLENGSTPLIRIDILKEVGCFDESLESSQDLDLYLKIAAKYRFVTVPKVQVKYRVTPGSITSKTAENEKKQVEFINKIFAQAPGKYKHLKRQRLSGFYRYLMLRTVEEEVSLKNRLRGLKYLILFVLYRPLILVDQYKFVFIMFSKISLNLMPKPLSNLLKRTLTS